MWSYFLCVVDDTSVAYTVDQNVLAKWRSNWYVGILKEVSDRRVYVDFYDGTHGNVPTQNIFPLVSIVEEDTVTMMHCMLLVIIT